MICDHISMMATKETLLPPATVRWTVADSDLIRLLQVRTGVESISDLIRLGLRALASKEGISA